MKRFFVIMLMVGLLAPVAAMAADGSYTAEPIKSGTNLISTLSNKVSLEVVSAGNAYAAITGHESGSKLFASTSGDTKIYVQDSDPVSITAPSDSDTAQFSAEPDTWKPL